MAAESSVLKKARRDINTIKFSIIIIDKYNINVNVLSKTLLHINQNLITVTNNQNVDIKMKLLKCFFETLDSYIFKY